MRHAWVLLGRTRPRNPAQSLVLLFLLLIVLGGALLELPICSRGAPADWSTAFFTATSAACVTGLAVVDTATAWSPVGQGLILLLIQVGGLGYMATSTLLFLLFRQEPDLNARLLLRATLGEITLNQTRQLFTQAVLFTLAFEAAGAVLLTGRFLLEPGRSFGDALWRGVFHSVSAFCNAGFDLFGQDGAPITGLGKYQDDWFVNLTMAALIIVGGLGFPVCMELMRHRGLKPLSLHTRVTLWFTVGLLAAGMLVFLSAEWSNPLTLGRLAVPEKLLAGFFQSVTLRTAGFATVDFAGLRVVTLMQMGVFMVIGAAPAGTAGGIKITTLAVTLAAIRASLLGAPDADLFRRKIPAEVVYRALVLIFVATGILVIGTTALMVLETPDARRQPEMLAQLQFEAMSAFGTVGLSTGVTPHLGVGGRLVLMALMFIGRLGPVTVATALTAPEKPIARHYPEERVPLG